MVIGTLTDYVISNLLDKYKDKLPDPIVNLITPDDSLETLLQDEIVPQTLKKIVENYSLLTRDTIVTERTIAPAIAYLVGQFVFTRNRDMDDLTEQFMKHVSVDMPAPERRQLDGFVPELLDTLREQMKRHMSAGDAVILDALDNQDKMLEDIKDLVQQLLNARSDVISKYSSKSSSVFISYARSDGEIFASKLREELAYIFGGDSIWQDRIKMRGSLNWWHQIQEGIDNSRFMVLIATPKALASKNVRDEWVYARQQGKWVYPVKVPRQAIDFSTMPRWMSDTHFYDLENEWENFIDALTKMDNPPKVPFMAPDLPDHFVERPQILITVMRSLLDENKDNPIAITTSFTGGGGFGKTTLATAVCHQSEIQTAFDDGILWITLGENPNVIDALTKMYRALTNDTPSFIDTEEGSRQLAEKLGDRDCLIIIDDVWNISDLRPFLRGGERCARLITSRRRDVMTNAKASVVDVDELRTEEAVKLLTGWLEGELTANEQALLYDLAKRLGEWALLLEIVGAELRSLTNDGRSLSDAVDYVVKRLKRNGVTYLDRDNENQRNLSIKVSIDASLNRLSKDYAQRLYELAIFPEDTNIPFQTIEQLWSRMAGYDDLDTEDALEAMNRLSFFTRYDTISDTLGIHDVVRQVLGDNLADEMTIHQELLSEWGDYHQLPDTYAWENITYHLKQADKLDELEALLIDYLWIKEKLQACNIIALIDDFEDFQEDETLNLIRSALENSAHVLAVDKMALGQQLRGRLDYHEGKVIQSFLKAILQNHVFEPFQPWLNPAGGPLLRTLNGHSDRVNGALQLQDGNILSWSADKTLRIWSPHGQYLHTLEGHSSIVDGAGQLQDGNILSWSPDKTLRLWSHQGHKINVLHGDSDSISGSLQLQDGNILSWSYNTLYFLSPQGQYIQSLEGHSDRVNGAVQLQDGNILSWSDDNTLHLWSHQGQLINTLDDHSSRVSGAVQLQDGNILSWSYNTLHFWSHQGQLINTLDGHSDRVNGAVQLQDGNILSWSDDKTLYLRTPQGRKINTLDGHSDSVNGVVQLHDGNILSWSADKTLQLWSHQGQLINTLDGHSSSVNGAVQLQDGNILSWSADKTLKLWTPQRYKINVLHGHSSSVYTILQLQDGNILSWSADKTLRLWTPQGREVNVLHGHSKGISGALQLQNGNILSWSADKTLRLWTPQGREINVLHGHSEGIFGALQLQDGNILSWSGTWSGGWGEDDLSLHLWSSQGQHIKTVDGLSDSVYAVVQLQDGNILSWNYNTLRIWSSQVYEINTLDGHSDRVNGALQLQGGNILSWSDDKTLRLWSPHGREINVLHGHSDRVNGAVQLQDGNILSWSDDKTLRLWSPHGQYLHTLQELSDSVYAVVQLQDGNILSWNADKTLQLWKPDGSPIISIDGLSDSVYAVVQLQDGNILSWNADKTLQLWNSQGQLLSILFMDAPITAYKILQNEHKIVLGDTQGRVIFVRYQP